MAATTVSAANFETGFVDGVVLDGVTLATGDRIIIKDQANQLNNGVWVVALTGFPSRAADVDEFAELQVRTRTHCHTPL